MQALVSFYKTSVPPPRRYDMLKLFETGKSHMALLTRGSPGSTGSKGGDASRHEKSSAGARKSADDQGKRRHGSGTNGGMFHSVSFRWVRAACLGALAACASCAMS